MSRPFDYSLLMVLLVLGACTSDPPLPPSEPPLASPKAALPKANEILFRALGLVGTPYRWGGNTPETGFDCSGLIVYVYREVAGIQLPRTTQAMSRFDVPRVARQHLQAGDVVFFAPGGKRISHAGIYVGQGRFVHAPSRGGRVRLDQLSNRYWQQAYRGARRMLDTGRLLTNSG